MSRRYRLGVCGGLLVWPLLQGGPCPPCLLAVGHCPAVGGVWGHQGEVLAGWGLPVVVGVGVGVLFRGQQGVVWVCVVVMVVLLMMVVLVLVPGT